MTLKQEKTFADRNFYNSCLTTYWRSTTKIFQLIYSGASHWSDINAFDLDDDKFKKT
jgi:hypothetical protein